MTHPPSPVLLVRHAGTDLVARACEEAVVMGSAARVLTALVACRLIGRRLLDHCTVISECLAARLRGDAPGDTSVEQLLTDSVAAAEPLLRRCLETITGQEIGALVQDEVIGPAGLTATTWSPQPTSTARDLARLLEAVDGGRVLDCAALDDLRDRRYALAVSGPPGYLLLALSGGGSFTAMRSRRLDLTVVGTPLVVTRTGARPVSSG
jgi:hypothetical protein